MKKSLYLKPDTFIVKVEAQAMLAGSKTIITVDTDGEIPVGGQAMTLDVTYKQDAWTHTTTSSSETDNSWDNWSAN